MQQQFLTAPRRAGGRNVIAIAADFGVWAGGFFWVWVFFNLIGPTWPTTLGDIPRTVLETALTLLLGSCMAFVTPALWSSVLPGTSAGMLLQSAQRRTLGFVALLAASLFLAYLSFQVIQSWWMSRPTVVEAGLVNPLTLTSLIFFVLVPALAWSWSTPAAWVHEIEQDHKVRQLRLAQETELALAKAGYSRALMIMANGLDNATMDQREYVAGVVMALHRGRNEQLRQVAGHLQALTGVEASLAWKDDALIGQLDQVRAAIVANEAPITEKDSEVYTPIYTPAPVGDIRHALNQIAPDVAADVATWADSRSNVAIDSAHVRTASQSSILHTAEGAQRGAAMRDDALRIVRAQLGATVWTKKDIARVLKVEERTAQETIAAWRSAGLAEETGRLGRYKLTEGV